MISPAQLQQARQQFAIQARKNLANVDPNSDLGIRVKQQQNLINQASDWKNQGYKA